MIEERELTTPVPPPPDPATGPRSRTSAPRALEASEEELPTQLLSAVGPKRGRHVEDDLPTSKMKAIPPDATPPHPAPAPAPRQGAARRGIADPDAAETPGEKRRTLRTHVANGLGNLAVACAVAGSMLTALWVLPWLQFTNAMFARAGRLIGYAWPLWTIALVAAAVSAVVDPGQRRSRAILAGICAIPLAIHTISWAPMYLAHPAPVGPNHLRVITVNADSGRMDAQLLVDNASRLNADVAVVQEINAGTYQAMSAVGWDDLFPNHTAAPGSGSGTIMVFSKTPVEVTSRVQGVDQFAARVTTPQGPWIVVTGHPADPGRTSADRWQEESRELADLAAAQDTNTPSVLVGDLNGTAQQAPMMRYRDAGFTDARKEVGKGWQATWPDGAWFPAYAGVDQVLPGPRARATDIDTFTVGTHRGLMVEVTAR